MLLAITLALLPVAMVLIVLGLLIVLMREFAHQNSGKPYFRGQFTHAQQRQGDPKSPVCQATQKQLLLLLQGDQQVAMRLVNRERVRSPHQHDQWIWEKVIHDLERDRH